MNETLDKVRSKRENAIPFIRLAFFAVRDIAPLEELCWDYGYKKGSVENKHLKCLCLEYEDGRADAAPTLTH